MKATKQYKFEEAKIKSSISRVKLWNAEVKKHIKESPDEIPFKELLLSTLIKEYNILIELEQIIKSRPIFKEMYEDKFYKQKLIAEKYLEI